MSSQLAKMSGNPANNIPINVDTTFCTIKVNYAGENRRFKLLLRDLGAHVFTPKLRFLLAIPPEAQVTFERYSDSAASYVTLDSNNPAVYKQLYRAAKAKLKLRIKATLLENKSEEVQSKEAEVTTTHPLANHMEAVPAPQTASQLAHRIINASLPNSTTETLVAPAKEETPQESGVSAKQSFMPAFHDFHTGIFCIDCNSCGNSIPNEHYHCSTCDDGDFDLCMGCIENGISCGGEDHWLIKRTLVDGKVVSSTTEILPVKKEKVEESKTLEIEESKPFVDAPASSRDAIERTCNCCIGEYPNSDFVSCADCYDFDLCKSCLFTGQHGHNPAHTFVPFDADVEKESYGAGLSALCKPGRNVPHMAICDGCDQNIAGVRHKCLNCPDWDYCSKCVVDSAIKHPGHRFAPLYEPIPELGTENAVHHGIYCDGVLCAAKPRQTYIRGIRYKCSICHDTDFCANCEASPDHAHNRTHPLIKFKTPLQHVTVTTLSEKLGGQKKAILGDRVCRRVPPPPASTPVRRYSVKTASTETVPTRLHNAATQVRTMADYKPLPYPAGEMSDQLDAHFVKDSVADGSVLAPDTTFEQVWTMTNPGPETWPAGCSARYTGGDWMLDVDTKHPSSVCNIYRATESTTTEDEVKPGKSFDFKVTLRTPAKEGRVISYWRLKSADGVPFGHKIWCDVSVRKPTAAAISPASTYEAPSVKEEREEETAKPQESSGMIFPKLDKESPAGSLYETAKVEPSVEKVSETSAQDTSDELIEDIESLDLDEDETEDDFLTDEEYDILDASDEEYLEAAQKAVK